ncbi:MAG: alpha/beta hydrolase [Planctomycetes bacterium]|nr:alpha/beta hydrolase [Planctomycetota bacterium]
MPHRAQGRRSVLLFPGFASPPDYYASLVESLAQTGLLVEVYCPPGVAQRREDTWGGDADSLIQDAATHRQDSLSVLIGHSWGCHLARAFARKYGTPTLIEIDPRLRSRTTPHATFDAPTRVAGKAEMIALYARSGNDVRWDWWEVQDDGSFLLRFNPAQLTQYLQYAWPTYPAAVWPHLQATNILVVRTLQKSLSVDDDVAAFKRDFPAVRWAELAEVSHALPPREQQVVAATISRFLEPLPSSSFG